MRVLVFGDIMGRVGRKALTAVLPEWKKRYAPDLIIANGENLAHGKGVSKKTVKELFAAGVDLITGGNHSFEASDSAEVLNSPTYKNRVIRPANYPAGVPGDGVATVQSGQKTVVVVNLQGNVNMPVKVDNPLLAFDAIRENLPEGALVLVDFHAETTSEANAFAWYVAGRAAAVWGTHTHVPTADERILTDGTAYQTDVGMTGYSEGVIGVLKESPIKRLLTGLMPPLDLPDAGPAVINALLITINEKNGQASKVERLQHYLET